MTKTVRYAQVRDEVVFSADGPQPRVLWQSRRLKTIVAGLEPGQSIPSHPESLAVYHFLEGTGWMLVDGERLPVAPGTTIFTPQGAARGMEAETRLVFIAARVDEGEEPAKS